MTDDNVAYFYSVAFANSATLVKTVVHEGIHLKQNREGRGGNSANAAELEAGAEAAEQPAWEAYKKKWGDGNGKTAR